MTIYQMLGHAIAGSVQSVGSAFRLFPTAADAGAGAARSTDWPGQFSAASLDERRARRTVNALYRGATVRL